MLRLYPAEQALLRRRPRVQYISTAACERRRAFSVLVAASVSCEYESVYMKLTGFAAVVGIAALAAFKIARRDGQPTRVVEIDDDTAADIIRRMLPALDRAYRLEFA